MKTQTKKHKGSAAKTGKKHQRPAPRPVINELGTEKREDDLLDSAPAAETLLPLAVRTVQKSRGGADEGDLEIIIESGILKQ